MQKIGLTIRVFLVLGVALWLTLFNSNDPEQETPEAVVPSRASLTGEYLCLPHTNSSGPQTDECAIGMKADDGKYYALDFNLMSETPPQLSLGDRFSANGTLTPIEMLSSDHWRKYPVVGIFSVTDSVEKIAPVVEATSATVTTTLEGSATALGITVNPRLIVSDSRCPEGVQCIWAGTMEVRTVISSAVAHGEHPLTLGKPQFFGDFTVTLTEVSPYPKSGEEIADSSYRFTFILAKR